MYKIVVYLSVLVIVSAAPQATRSGDLDAIISEIFGPPPTTAAPSIKPFQPSTIVPPVTSTASEKSVQCVTDEGKQGFCVHYYLCSTNNSIITDGIGVIDIRQPTASGPTTQQRMFQNRAESGERSLLTLGSFCLSCYEQMHEAKKHKHYRAQDDKCPSYLDVCCALGDTRDPQDPITPAPDKLPQREGCGWRNPDGVGFKITGAKDGEASFAEFPWMVAVLKIEPVDENDVNSQRLNVYVGGGSLIHPNIVLTAAHYVATTKSLRVRAGEWDTQTTKEIYSYQDRDVESVEIHKDFNKGNLFYDIALLFLSKPMDLAPNVGVVCLPPPRQRVPGGTQCFASGWGKDKFGKEGRYQVILKKVQLDVVERNQCQKQLRQTRLGHFFELHTSFMCAGGKNGADTCKGDGGSPLVCPIEFEQDRYIQSGIVAWGIGCGQDGTPGVYVDVSNLRNWIDDKVKEKQFSVKEYTY